MFPLTPALFLHRGQGIISMKSFSQFFNNRNVLGPLFMLPAAALLLVFLTYPQSKGSA
jgi:hypothetical protein